MQYELIPTDSQHQASLKAEHGVNVFYSDADLKQPKQIKTLVDTAADKLGGMHILWCALLLLVSTRERWPVPRY
jgi:hypothetical protein